MQDVSLLSLLGRLVVSLAIVLALMAALAWVLRNRMVPGIRRPTAPRDTLQVVARHALSRSASVAVVRAADRALVIGISDSGVTLLTEIDPATLDTEDPEAPSPLIEGPSWRGFVDTLRERSVRRT